MSAKGCYSHGLHWDDSCHGCTASMVEQESAVEIELLKSQREKLEEALRAVLLFHGGGPWNAERQNSWHCITGNEEATIKVLCDLARTALASSGITTDKP